MALPSRRRPVMGRRRGAAGGAITHGDRIFPPLHRSGRREEVTGSVSRVEDCAAAGEGRKVRSRTTQWRGTLHRWAAACEPEAVRPVSASTMRVSAPANAPHAAASVHCGLEGPHPQRGRAMDGPLRGSGAQLTTRLAQWALSVATTWGAGSASLHQLPHTRHWSLTSALGATARDLPCTAETVGCVAQPQWNTTRLQSSIPQWQFTAPQRVALTSDSGRRTPVEARR